MYIYLFPISKKYHKYTTKYNKYTTKFHKYTTKVLQSSTKMSYCTIKQSVLLSKCNILPISVVFFKNNPTTNCSIPLQNIAIYHQMMYYTMNSSISTTEVVFYHIM